ncbi:type VI secretion system-associated protein TagF [Shimia sp. MIT1388]|uniref:type VI secretion system-associated protein TagF n=1 Tax=Shimia sp. MIT1388 TaxID=3096992 RepID=UPI00399B7F61
MSGQPRTYQSTTGFFGKVPGAGDFVARGLSPGVRGVLDHFLTSNLSQAARRPELWPESGIRAAITAPTAPLLICIVPSLDAHKRAFPVAACIALNATDQTSANAWAEAVIEPLWHEDNVEALFAALQAAPRPFPSETPIAVPSVWFGQTTPQDLEKALSELFCSS